MPYYTELNEDELCKDESQRGDSRNFPPESSRQNSTISGGNQIRLFSPDGNLVHVQRSIEEEAEEFLASLGQRLPSSETRKLADHLTPSNCLGLRNLALQENFLKVVALCDRYIAKNLEKMLTEKEFLSLPRVQTKIDVSEEANNVLSSSSTISHFMPTIARGVVRELAEIYYSTPRRWYLEEQLHEMELQEDLSIQMSSYVSTKKKTAAATESRKDLTPEKPIAELINLIKKVPSPARKLQLEDIDYTGEVWSKPSKLSSPSKFSSTHWDILGMHNLAGYGATCLVRGSIHGLLVVNIQMSFKMTKGRRGSSSLCPISPTTGIPLVAEDIFFSPMSKCRGGFALLPLLDQGSDDNVISSPSLQLMSTGGFNREGVLRTTEVYDTATNTWIQLTTSSNLLTDRARFAAVTCDGVPYVIGGSDGRSELRSVECFSSKDREWKRLPSRLNIGRSDFGAAELNGLIYAIGGTHYSTPISSVEVLNTRSSSSGVNRKWQILTSSMSKPRKGVAAVSCGNKIYVIGGQTLSWACLDLVESYDPVSNQWEKMAPMSMPRRNACAVVLDGLIYVIGGYNGSAAVNFVEVYDPASDAWSVVDSMANCRSNASAVAVNGSIYVAGGFTGTLFLNSVEQYDAASEQWTGYFNSYKN